MTQYVDVVIPTFNSSQFIKECVNSVLGQTHPVNNIFISDDGSTDDTTAVVNALAQNNPNIKLICNKHHGVSHTRNVGIRHSNAPYIAFLDSDDIWEPDKIEKQMSIFNQAEQDTGLVFSSYRLIDEAGTPYFGEPVIPPKKRGYLFKDLLFEDFVISGSASGVLIKRKFLDQVGYFDERMYYGEDGDLWIRLSSVCSFDFDPDPLLKIRVHHKSAQRKIYKRRELAFLRQILLIYEKWPNEISNEANFTDKLRKKAIFTLLPLVKGNLANWYHVFRFHQEIKDIKLAHGKPLFSGYSDLSIELLTAIKERAIHRIKIASKKLRALTNVW